MRVSLVSAALRTHFVANRALILKQILAGDDDDDHDDDHDDDDHDDSDDVGNNDNNNDDYNDDLYYDHSLRCKPGIDIEANTCR